MSAELATVQQELTIYKLQNELLQVKNELALVQAKKASKLEDSLFSPALYEHYSKIAERMAKSSMVPKNYIGKPNDILIAMEMGYQLGFSIAQSLQNIAVINGMPCLWGDGLMALVLSHPQCEYIKENWLYDDKGNVIGGECIVKRKRHEEHRQVFTLSDAKKAGLLTKQGPWQQYPLRMLQMRARAFAVRDRFADALRGIKVAEEVQDYIDGEIVDRKAQNDASLTQTERLKNKLKTNANKGLNHENATTAHDASTGSDNASHQSSNQETAQTTGENEGSERLDSNRKEEVRAHHPTDTGEEITQEQRNTIEKLIKEKTDYKADIKDMFQEYNVPAVKYLTSQQADNFIFKLESL